MTTTTPRVRTGRVGGVEYFVHGEGGPVSLFAHGLAGSAAEMQPLASGVEGTRVLMNFRGHGRSDAPTPGWDYEDLAADLLAVADETGATRAVGLSMGAAALLRTVTAHVPGRFERLAFLLPVSVDVLPGPGASTILREMGALAAGGDEAGLADRLLAEIPAVFAAMPAAQVLARRRARLLVRTPPPTALGAEPPVADPALLATIDVPVLVVSQAADPVHVPAVAAALAAAVPGAELLELPEHGAFWTAREVLQGRLARHLAP